MTDHHTPTADSAGWIEWGSDGGRFYCPVGPTTRIDVRFADGCEHLNLAAGNLYWKVDSTIVAYRLSDRLPDEVQAQFPKVLAALHESEKADVAGAIERLTKVLDGPFNLGANGYADADIRALIADRARLSEEPKPVNRAILDAGFAKIDAQALRIEALEGDLEALADAWYGRGMTYDREGNGDYHAGLSQGLRTAAQEVRALLGTEGRDDG